MMSDYFSKDVYRSPTKKQDTSGSFGFRSSQFSQKNNNSIDGQAKNIDPSFFNQSSIQKLNNSQSGEFIYFQNDSVLTELELQLKNKKKKSSKQQQKEKKKKYSINYQKEISFQDSLHKSIKSNNSEIKEYGTGKSNLPPTLKKPKFGFKVSQTAESSAIIKDLKDVQKSVTNQVNQEYQLKASRNMQNQSKNYQSRQISKQQISGYKNSKLNKKQNSLQNENSISSIKRPSDQPSVVSKSLSQSNSINGSMNFKSVFKHKVQKASVINSSLNKNHKGIKSNNSILSQRQMNKSLSRHGLMQRQVKITELKDLRELQNKLGEIKHQNKKIIEYMIQKDQQIQHLKNKKVQIQSEDPYAIIKENQLMKAFLNTKNKRSSKKLNELNDLGYAKCLHSAKSLKQISLKKSSQISSLYDYDIKQHKFKVDAKPLTKLEKKFILANRGMILTQKYLDVGYSLKDNVLTLYLTLKKQCDQVRIKLQQNSFILSQAIDRVFKDSGIGKQMKFKTEIKSTKCINPQDQYEPLCLKISLSSQQKFENKMNQFKVELPISVYNVTKQLNVDSQVQISQKSSRLSAKQIFKTQTFVACKQMVRDPQNYLLKIFPTGIYLKDQNVFQIGFVWKEKQDLLRIRVKQRSFVIQGEGNPNRVSFEILRSIVSLLIQFKQDK